MRRLAIVLLCLVSCDEVSEPPDTDDDTAQCHQDGLSEHIEQIGQTLLIEVDSEFVVQDADKFYLLESPLAEFVSRHYTTNFDQLFVWTTSWQNDNRTGGAYHASVSVPCAPQLQGISHMGAWEDDSSHSFSVLAQEFSHRWLAYAHFIDPVTQLESDELLGRDGSHWSALLDAGASFQDGIHWRWSGDKYVAVSKATRWSALDLWLMGLATSDEVPIMLLFRNAVKNGNPVEARSTVSLHDEIDATPIQISIDDIMKVTEPAEDRRGKPYRVAFVVLTQSIDESSRQAAREIDTFRTKWTEWVQQKLWCRTPFCSEMDGECGPTCSITCGDFLCQGPETEYSCPTDCSFVQSNCEQSCALMRVRCDSSEQDEITCLEQCPSQFDAGWLTQCLNEQITPDLCACSPSAESN